MGSFPSVKGFRGSVENCYLLRGFSRQRWIRLAVLGPLSVGILLATTGTSHGQDESVARKMANAIAKTTAVNYFKQWKFEFDEPGLKGKVKAVKPEEHVKVDIKEFRLFETSVTLTLAIDALYEFNGEVKAGDKTVAVKGNGDIFHVITARAGFRQEDGKLIITPRIQRLKLEVKRLKTEPADLPGAEKVLKAAIAKNEHRFLKDLNDWLTKNSVKSE